MLSRDNIQRVRRDEAEAKAKEEEKQRRAEIAVSVSCRHQNTYIGMTLLKMGSFCPLCEA